MGYVADQFLVLLIILYLFICILPEPDAHLLKILAQLPYLIVRIHIQGKVQVAVPYLLSGLLQLIKRA